MGLMIKKILVPTDFSDLTKSAMSYAIRIARVFGAEIHILHVVEGYEHNVMGETEEVTQEILKKLKKYLRSQTPMQFLMRPEFKPFIDGMGNWKWSTDQTLLNVFVKESGMKVKNLTYHWNGLFTGIEMNRIPECNFVHFFLKDKLPARGENVEELMTYVN